VHGVAAMNRYGNHRSGAESDSGRFSCYSGEAERIAAASAAI